MSGQGKVAVVTGAARQRGIGRGVATRLARDGYAVAINDVAALDEGRALEDQLTEAGHQARFYPADVADRGEVQAMFNDIERDLGPASVICSNAGVADWSPFEQIPEQMFDRLVAVNLTGAFNVGQEAAKRMVGRGIAGRIVFVSSVHVQMPFADMAIYGATKQGIRALAEAMAIELGSVGITVNHVGPGWVKSFLNDASPSLQTPDDEAATLALIPLGRPAEPEEIAAAVSFLCSAEASYITGEYLRVDGGFVVGKY